MTHATSPPLSIVCAFLTYAVDRLPLSLSPLRSGKNLHYKVVSKPSAKSDTIKAIADYILQHHKDDTGIIYCLSRKEAQEVADDLANITNGQIKTGVYHAEVGDSAKERLHIQWREGKVKVVCATIAFGLGIDKGDVRFVIHHSVSSLKLDRVARPETTLP